MGHRWKPNKTQAREYAKRMREQEEKYDFISTKFPIREGCWVKFVRKNTSEVVTGHVVTSSYGTKRGQHTFNIAGVLVKGRNLYDRILEHIPGHRALKDKYLSTFKSYPTDDQLKNQFPEEWAHISKELERQKERSSL